MTPEKGKEKQNIFQLVQPFLCAILLSILVFTFVGRITRVDGPSMRDTLQDRDLLLTLNANLCGGFRAGDIVIFSDPDFEGGQAIVKRVIATEGQTVDIQFRKHMVLVDGEVLDEPYILEPTQLWEGVKFPLTVPEGCVFVMGDNRNDSKDSRHPDLGPLDTRYIQGKALFLAVPGPSAETNERDWSRIGPLR